MRSFTGFKPPARFDDEPFTTVRLEESASRSGPWEDIDVFALSPADADPSAPASRDFTTSAATEDPGWYRLTWVDADNDTFVGDPVRFGGGLVSVDDVLAVLHLSEVSAEQAGRITTAIEVAEDWARRYLRQPNLGLSGVGVIDSYWGQTYIPYSGALTELRVTPFPGAAPTVIPTNAYEASNGFIRVHTADWVWPGLPADEHTWPGNYRIDVVTSQDGSLDPVIRQGIATAAAAVWQRGPRTAKGLQSESLGDYSYTLASGSSGSGTGSPYFAEAKDLLRPRRRRGPMVV